jgi:hypothetical protein
MHVIYLLMFMGEHCLDGGKKAGEIEYITQISHESNHHLQMMHY